MFNMFGSKNKKEAPKEECFSQKPNQKTNRDKAMAAYKKFIERGITSPDALDSDDPEVKEANELFFNWVAEEDSFDGENEKLEMASNLLKNMFYVDAGFTAPEYLSDVLEWLDMDLHNVEEWIDDPIKEILTFRINDAKKKVESLLTKQEPGK